MYNNMSVPSKIKFHIRLWGTTHSFDEELTKKE